ncbi:m24 family peptidase [Mycobacterium xenopi 3993]|nr:m24 family peptidase [Mycobacterium xenopi 3993]
MVVRATGAIHLLSTWDEGVPDDIPHENLYGIAWNPMNTISVLKRIEGASTAKRVGTDALSPTFAQLLPMAFPKAELVDGELAMRAARRVKTPEEVDALRAAIRVAETGLAAAVSELRPGVSENTLAGVLLESMAAGGVSTPSTQDVAWVTSPEHPWRRGSDDRRVRPAIWWPSPRACSPAVTPARWAGRGQSASREASRPPPTCIGAGRRCGAGLLTHARRAHRPPTCWPPTKSRASRHHRCRWRGPGHGLRPAGGVTAFAGDRRRGKAGARHGARGHRLRLGARRRRGVRPRCRADHRRWRRGIDD